MVTGAERSGGGNRRRPSQSHKPEPDHQETLTLRNRQRLRPLNLPLLRRVVRALLQEAWPDASFDLAVYVVAAPRITQLNETFLHHQGSTDVITFDYAESAGQASRPSSERLFGALERDRRDACPTLLHGEIFVCVDEAVSQARRFRTTWQSELVRYIVHGILHLLGYKDSHSRARRKMKVAEDALVRRLSRQFDFRWLSRPG
jgi:probable rRNA maturation factor